jgi:hypothetical protein
MQIPEYANAYSGMSGGILGGGGMMDAVGRCQKFLAADPLPSSDFPRMGIPEYAFAYSGISGGILAGVGMMDRGCRFPSAQMRTREWRDPRRRWDDGRGGALPKIFGSGSSAQLRFPEDAHSVIQTGKRSRC